MFRIPYRAETGPNAYPVEAKHEAVTRNAALVIGACIILIALAI